MNETELNEIKAKYSRLGDDDANIIHQLIEEIERLRQALRPFAKMAEGVGACENKYLDAKSSRLYVMKLDIVDETSILLLAAEDFINASKALKEDEHHG